MEPGRWETNDAVLNDIEEIAAEAEVVLRPDQMIWVVVGDRAVIEDGIRELGIGEVRFLDADGQPVAE